MSHYACARGVEVVDYPHQCEEDKCVYPTKITLPEKLCARELPGNLKINDTEIERENEERRVKRG